MPLRADKRKVVQVDSSSEDEPTSKRRRRGAKPSDRADNTSEAANRLTNVIAKATKSRRLEQARQAAKATRRSLQRTLQEAQRDASEPTEVNVTFDVGAMSSFLDYYHEPWDESFLNAVRAAHALQLETVIQNVQKMDTKMYQFLRNQVDESLIKQSAQLELYQLSLSFIQTLDQEIVDRFNKLVKLNIGKDNFLEQDSNALADFNVVEESDGSDSENCSTEEYSEDE
jgi:hypothetical protein